MKRLIFGCGYVGLPVAQAWAAAGDDVFAVTRSAKRSKDFSELGLIPIVGDVTKPKSINDLPKVDTLLIAIGMDRSRYDDIRDVYVGGMETILGALPNECGHIIYISSTGVYGDFGGEWVREDSATDPTRDGGKACLEAEQLLWACPFADRTTVLRLSGIYGPGRIPSMTAVKSQQWNKLNPHGYLNLIHLADIIAAILATAEQRPFGETALVSDGTPVNRREYYEFIAREIGVGPIDWPVDQMSMSDRSASSKRVCNQKMLDLLNLNLAFPDFRSGLKNALAS